MRLKKTVNYRHLSLDQDDAAGCRCVSFKTIKLGHHRRSLYDGAIFLVGHLFSIDDLR